MTPQDHYREAEQFIRSLDGMAAREFAQVAPTVIAAAHVHATLALAAATALAHSDGREWQRWADVATADPAVA